MSQPLRPLFRPAQQEALKYRSGHLAISAVPGSGKTFTLTHIAANLVSQLSKRDLAKGREVLIVTFTNSAVNSLRQRIAHTLQRDRALLPYAGYRVRTLHGLSHDIIRERPSIVGLPEDFIIMDDRNALKIMSEIVYGELRTYSGQLDYLIDPELVEDKQRIKRIKEHELPDLMLEVCLRFVRHSKDNQLTPGDYYAHEATDHHHSLWDFCLRVYDGYQRSLRYQSAVDFDDLGRLALEALNSDERFLARLQRRWTYILEDEAQDSSLTQQTILTRLSETSGNWVRVGDSNQAINTTFTTANYKHFLDFSRHAKDHIQLNRSGRSGFPIADVANALIAWSIHEHPIVSLRASFDFQQIETTLPGDPQPAPPSHQTRVHIHYQPGQTITPQQEIDLLLENLSQWLPNNMDKTVAVLTPENSRGFKVVEQLNNRKLSVEELLRTTTGTRQVTTALYRVLTYMAGPLNSQALSELYRDVWREWIIGVGDTEELGETEDDKTGQGVVLLARCRRIEDYLWPTDEAHDWLSDLKITSELLNDLREFRDRVRRWLAALILPIDQLILTVAQDIFRAPDDLALSHKIARIMRSIHETNPAWQLADLNEELRIISQNERRFLGMEDLISGYEPKPGMITVATMHAAKGLEWDRVYLLGVNHYSFPSGGEDAQYIGEKWFIRDRLNIEAEALALIDAVVEGETHVEGVATQQARIDYSAERLRLFYVGITRAKEELIILWNSGRFWYRGNEVAPALPLMILQEYLSGIRIIHHEGES